VTARRRPPLALLAIAMAITLVASMVPLGGPVAAAIPDVAAIGDLFSPSSGPIANAAGYMRFPAGPDTGAPSVIVDPPNKTVNVTVNAAGRTSVLTIAWPARIGIWTLGIDGAEPEQHVDLRRGTSICHLTFGRLEIRQATVSAGGGVAGLTADISNGGCALGSNAAGYAGASIRIGSAEAMSAVPQGQPAAVDTGAEEGTVVQQRVVVTNVGGAPWTVRRTGTGSTNSWSPTFAIVAGSDTCLGATLAPGGQCDVTVAATARNYLVMEHLVVAGNGAADLVVPLKLEGYAPVPAPTGATVVPGRLSSTVSWDSPATNPRTEYRIYDVVGGQRTLVATAAPTGTSVSVPGHGPRSLALVAANGPFAESPDVALQVPGVTAEVVANDWYSFPVAFTVLGAGPSGSARPSGIGSVVRLDAARRSWVTPRSDGLLVCSVDREVCSVVPGTASSSLADQVREAIWLLDGRIAFLRGDDFSKSLWVVARDGSGLRRVAATPYYSGQMVAAPDGSQILMRGGPAMSVVRMRLSDGQVTVIPHTEELDDFTVTTAGRLVLERRLDMSSTDGPTRITMAALDGSGAHDLALPTGNNREVTFDPSGARMAFVRCTAPYQCTLWVAAADGSGARQLSDRSAGWLDLQWSADDVASPLAAVGGPSFSGRAVSLIVGASDPDDPVGSLRRECRLDGASAWTGCGATWALSALAAGRHTAYARVTDPSGRQSAVVSRSWTVDVSAPTTSVTAVAAVLTSTTSKLTWRSTDTGGAGVASYDVRMRRASPYGRFGSYLYPGTWQTLKTPSLTLGLTAGYQYCLSVRARDASGNVGAWSPERCTSVALDDRSLSASRGWTRGRSSAYSYGTWSGAARTGVSLTRTSVQGRRIALVVTTCPTCGVVDVYHAGVKIGRVSLYSSRTAYRQIRWLPLQSVTRTGTVVVRTVGSKRVYIDGFAVQH
jgi:hypothetical protein